MLKITAALSLIGSGYFFGKSMDKKLKERAELLRMLSESVVYLKEKICQEACTLPEALSATAVKCCSYPESIYERAAYYMVSEGLEGTEAWNRGCDSCAEGRILGADGIALLKTAGSLLGSGDRTIQEENLEQFSERLQKSCLRAEDKERRDGKLYIKMGLAAGCIAAILFW